MSVLGEQLQAEKDFLREVLPQLIPTVDRIEEHIITLYEQAGCPNGVSPDVAEMRDKAVEWYEGERNMWQQARLEDGVQARLDHFIQQAHLIGDRESVDGVELETPKGIARRVVSAVSVMIEQADTDNRPLTDFECFTLEYHLGTAYAAIVSYREQKAGM